MLKSLKISLIVISVLLTSCSEYNKILNKGDATERYTMATELYKAESYQKSNRLYELILPAYATKPQKEVILYRLADGNFKVGDFTTSIYYYEKFIRNFPKSTELENAQYKIAENYYNLSPKYSIDQTDTRKSIEAFQNFINNNPDSDKISKANKKINDLNFKLETKAFEIAKQYYKVGNYSSAMVAFDNMIFDYLGTSYKEEAMYYKFKSAYELGINSVEHKKQNRIDEALKVYTKYKKTFPNSEYLNKADDLYNELLNLNKPKQEQTS